MSGLGPGVRDAFHIFLMSEDSRLISLIVQHALVRGNHAYKTCVLQCGCLGMLCELSRTLTQFAAGYDLCMPDL